MKEKYTPFLLSGTGKALVLLGSAGLLAAGIYGVTEVRVRVGTRPAYFCCCSCCFFYIFVEHTQFAVCGFVIVLKAVRFGSLLFLYCCLWAAYCTCFSVALFCFACCLLLSETSQKLML